MPDVPDTADSRHELHKVRIVCISDTHNASPADGAFKLPRGDVLIHAGDLTNQGTYRELEKTLTWIKDAEYAFKIIIAGNHDLTLDLPFYTEYGPSIHNQNIQDPIACQNLIQSFCRNSNIIYLQHSSTTIFLPAPNNHIIPIRVFGSPYSPLRKGSSGPAAEGWAFKYPYSDSSPSRPSSSLSPVPPTEATRLWAQIPLETDLVITHTPAATHLDTSAAGRSLGCPDLRNALWRVRPRLAICGHIHEARGAELVTWDLSTVGPAAETSWAPVGAKISPPDGKVQSHPRALKPYMEVLPNETVDIARKGNKTCRIDATGLANDGGGDTIPATRPDMAITENDNDGYDIDNEAEVQSFEEKSALKRAMHPSRLKRKETLFVNAALKARSWGQRGPKVWNQAVVVELAFRAYPRSAFPETDHHPDAEMAEAV